MFKILYHPSETEQIDPEQLKAAGFDGLESSIKNDSFSGVFGLKCADLSLAIGELQTGKYAYASFEPRGDWSDLVKLLNGQPPVHKGFLAVEPWNMRRTVRELWQFSETIESKNIRLAISSEWSMKYEQAGARAIPTLNHRIGVVRVNASENEIAMDYSRRLAGIGYDGFLVINGKSTGMEEAGKLAQSIKHLLEPPAPKPKTVAKKPVAAKASE